jgi:hypothetical protein
MIDDRYDIDLAFAFGPDLTNSNDAHVPGMDESSGPGVTFETETWDKLLDRVGDYLSQRVSIPRRQPQANSTKSSRKSSRSSVAA